ncbi:hypothetical protein [Sphingomonas montana]|uniref:hypothetical protein n=1 Tax=Sphingomonas montana TaxID=1843236 RepID=UPI0009FAB29D|nr:hypothetical protein [Sphingomonas montana]
MSDTTRWQPTIAYAAATGSVPWQYASLATGLVGLACVAVRGTEAPSGGWLVLSILQAALVLAGLWLSLRLRIDTVLFHALAKAGDMDAFDRAMVELGLLEAGKVGRPMPDRVRGLMRLVRLLAVVVVTQLGLLIATGWLAWQ